MEMNELKKSRNVQFNLPLHINLNLSKDLFSPDTSPKSPTHYRYNTLNSPSHPAFKPYEDEMKKNSSANKRNTLNHLHSLSFLPKFLDEEDREIHHTVDYFYNLKILNKQPNTSVVKNQLIYKHDKPEFIVNLMNLRKANFEHRKMDKLGQIFVSEFWDRNHYQQIVSNSKLLERSRRIESLKYENKAKTYENFKDVFYNKRRKIHLKEEQDYIFQKELNLSSTPVRLYQKALKIDTNPNNKSEKFEGFSMKPLNSDRKINWMEENSKLMKDCQESLKEDLNIKKLMVKYKNELNDENKKKKGKKENGIEKILEVVKQAKIKRNNFLKKR